MAILVLVNSDYIADTRVRNQCELLSAKYCVTVLCRAGPAGEDRLDVASGVEIKRLAGARRTRAEASTTWTYILDYWRFFIACFCECWRLRKCPPALVVVHTMPDFLVLAALPLRRRAPVVLDVHDLMPELYEPGQDKRFSLGKRILLAQEKVSHRLAAYRVTVNTPVAHHLESRTGLTYDVFHNGPMRTAVEAASSCRMPARSSGDANFRIVFLGNAHFRYRIDLMLKSMPRLLSEHPHVTLDIHGDGPALKSLVRLSSELGIGEHVSFHGRYLPSDVPVLLQNKSLGVFLAENTGQNDLALPVKVLEYAAHGVPIFCRRLATTLAYFPESCVTYFDQDSEVCSTLIKLLREKDRLADGREEAYAIQKRLDWKAEGPKYMEYISSVIASHSDRSAEKGPAPH